jgi:chromosome segregation ATPase
MSTEKPKESRLDSLQREIAALNNDVQQHEIECQKRKEMLVEASKEVEHDYMKKVSIFQSKLSALLEQAKWNETQHQAEMRKMKKSIEEREANYTVYIQDSHKKWDTTFKSFEERMQKSLQREHEERTQEMQRLKDRLRNRDNQVERLLDVVAKQGKELEEAQKHRDEMQKEMKNVLVTLHVQFEHLMAKANEQNEKISELQESQKKINDSNEVTLTNLGSTVDTLRQDFDEFKGTTNERFQVSSGKDAAVRKELEQKMMEILDSKHISIMGDIYKNRISIATLSDKLMNSSIVQERTSEDLEETKKLLSQMEMNLKSNHAGFELKMTTALENYYESTNENLDQRQNAWQSEKTELLQSLNEQSEKIEKTGKNVAQLSEKVEDMSHNATLLEQIWKKTFDSLDSKFFAHLREVEELKKRVSSIHSERAIMEGSFCNQLNDITAQLKQRGIEQLSIQKEFERKHQDLSDEITLVNSIFDRKFIAVDELKGQMEKDKVLFEEMYEALQVSHKEAVTTVKTTESMLKGWNDVVEDTIKDIRLRSEAHVLANKDFTTKLNKQQAITEHIEQRLNSWAKEFENLAWKVRDMGDKLTSKSSGETILDRIKVQENELKSIKEKIDSISASGSKTSLEDTQTWESLFQHVAFQITEQAMEVSTLKESNKKTAEMLEQALSLKKQVEFGAVSSPDTSSKEIDLVLQTLDDYKKSLSIIENKIEEQKSVQESLQAAQTDSETNRARLETKVEQLNQQIVESLGDLKNDLEESVEVLKVSLLTSSGGIESQNAQRRIDQQTLEKKMVEWYTSFENQVLNVQQETRELKKIVEMRKRDQIQEQALAQTQKMFSELADQTESHPTESRDEAEQIVSPPYTRKVPYMVAKIEKKKLVASTENIEEPTVDALI